MENSFLVTKEKERIDLNSFKIYKYNEYSKSNLKYQMLLFPTVAFKVKVKGLTEPLNIIDKSILKLKELNFSNNQVAETLCLNVELINEICDFYKKTGVLKNGQLNTSQLEQVKKRRISEINENIKRGRIPKNPVVGYIFYNCLTKEIIPGSFIEEAEFKRNTNVYIREGKVRDKYIAYSSSLSSSDTSSNPKINIAIQNITLPAKIRDIDVKKAFSKDGYSKKDVVCEYLFQHNLVYMEVKCKVSSNNYTVTNPFTFLSDSDFTYSLAQALKFEDNEHIQEKINLLKETLYRSDANIELGTQKNVKIIEKEILKEYSPLLKENYGEILDRLINYKTQLDYFKKDKKNSESQFKQLTVTAFQVLRTAFFRCFVNNYNDDLQSEDFYNIKEYARNCGFNDEETLQKFFKDVTVSSIEHLSSNTKTIIEYEEKENGQIVCNIGQLSTILAGCIICASKNPNHTFWNLANKAPKLIEFLITFGNYKKSAKHDGEEISFPYKPMDKLIKQILVLLFPELNIKRLDNSDCVDGIKTEKEDLTADIQYKVDKKINSYKLLPVLKDRLSKFVRVYYEKSTEYFALADNLLKEIYSVIIDYSLEKITSDDIKAKFKFNAIKNYDLILSIVNNNGKKYKKDDIWFIDAKKLNWFFDNREMSVMSTNATVAFIALSLLDRSILNSILNELPMLVEYTKLVHDKRGTDKIADYTDETVSFLELTEDLCAYSERITKLVGKEELK